MDAWFSGCVDADDSTVSEELEDALCSSVFPESERSQPFSISMGRSGAAGSASFSALRWFRLTSRAVKGCDWC